MISAFKAPRPAVKRQSRALLLIVRVHGHPESKTRQDHSNRANFVMVNIYTPFFPICQDLFLVCSQGWGQPASLTNPVPNVYLTVSSWNWKE